MNLDTRRPVANAHDDLLWQQLKTLPAFRAVLRAVEARFYHHIPFPEPVLDVGCGDGNFAAVALGRGLRAGIDPWWNPLRKALAESTYDLTLQVMADRIPFPDHYFGSAFSNSVIEHIPDIQPVLNEVSRVLKPGATFVITTPSHYFTECLGGARLFERLGSTGLANAYRRFFNRISRHAHTDSPDVWTARFAAAGFEVERWQYYFSEKALHALEIGHAQGLPAAAMHALTGHWIVAPWNSSLKPTERWLRPFYDEPFPDKGAYILMILRKVADGPVDAALPPPRPFTLAELTPSTPLEPAPPQPPITPAVASATTAVATAVAEEDPAPAGRLARAASGGLLISGALALLALLFALFGQAAWRANPAAPGAGLAWFAASALALFVLTAWLRDSRGDVPRIRLPDLRGMPRERWLWLLALAIVFVAQRFASPFGTPRPTLAILLWLLGGGLGFYALLARSGNTAVALATLLPRTRTTWLIAAGLFALALLPRLVNLASHPFILNGTEANIGLDAAGVVNGSLRNPFATAWLTNPTLPLFVLAVPLRLLGQTVVAVRLLSTVGGALTVTAVYLIGQRVWNRPTGLVAAVLLLGSHFHVHFSRLGMTNVWDGLLVLLALGLIAIAWMQDPAHNRLTWLLAGTAVGLNAYLFTSSHLLPLILIGIGALVLIFDRRTLARQARHAVAAGMLALLIALPMLLFYRAMPGVFMERANALGIFGGQSGWLAQEATRSGQTTADILFQQVSKAALAFNATLDSGTSFGATVPFLGYVTGVLFMLGVLLALLHLRELRYQMLLVWVLVTVVFAGALLLNPPESHRYIVAAPAAVLLAAIGLVGLASAFRRPGAGDAAASGWRRPALVLGVLVTIAALLAALDLAYYFGPYRTQHRFGDRNTEVAAVMAEYLNELDGDWAAYFFGPPSMYVGFPTIPYLVTDFRTGENLFDVEEPTADLQPTQAASRVFIYLPEREGELAAIEAQYPGGTLRRFDGYYAQPLFLAYEVTGAGP